MRSDLEARTFLQLFPDPKESTGDIYNASFKSVDMVEEVTVVHRKGMRSFAVASEFHNSGSPVSFYLRSDRSLPLVSPSNTATGPGACLGREAQCPRTVLLAGRLLVASKFPNDGCFSCLQGFPHSRVVCRGKTVTGFQSARSRRTSAARLRGQGGAWGVGCLEALAHSRLADWPSLMSSLPSGTVQKEP